MFDDLGMLDSWHSKIIDEAIVDGRVEFAVQQVCGVAVQA